MNVIRDVGNVAQNINPFRFLPFGPGSNNQKGVVRLRLVSAAHSRSRKFSARAIQHTLAAAQLFSLLHFLVVSPWQQCELLVEGAS